MTLDDRNADEKHESADSPVGLTRFHCITIGAGALLCLAFGIRMFLEYRHSDEVTHLGVAMIAVSFSGGLFTYLRRFRRQGI